MEGILARVRSLRNYYRYVIVVVTFVMLGSLMIGPDVFTYTMVYMENNSTVSFFSMKMSRINAEMLLIRSFLSRAHLAFYDMKKWSNEWNWLLIGYCSSISVSSGFSLLRIIRVAHCAWDGNEWKKREKEIATIDGLFPVSLTGNWRESVRARLKMPLQLSRTLNSK